MKLLLCYCYTKCMLLEGTIQKPERVKFSNQQHANQNCDIIIRHMQQQQAQVFK